MKYLVMAYRFRANDYIFPVGIFETKESAINAAKIHHDFRGGKYDHKIYEIEENHEYDAEEAKYFWVQDK